MLTQLRAGGDLSGRHVVVVAHPDDETIACGGLLQRIPQLRIIQLTSGAFSDRELERIAMRRQERAQALRALGVSAEVLDLDCPDRAAHLHLARIVNVLTRELADADVVWTHAYEGGHLDHDTCAAAVHAAADDLVCRMEFASYFWNGEESVFGAFAGGLIVEQQLTGERWTRKQAALACYASQAGILRKFKTPDIECYRQAPRYDFRQPPLPWRTRWDVKGYEPSTEDWRRVVAGRKVAA